MTDFAVMDDGCKLAFQFDGPASAPVLALSNSLGTNIGMWEPQMAAFTSAYRVLRYDSRGHGKSDSPPGAYSLDRLGRDFLGLLDHLKLDKVRYCGLSKGGMVGQWLGARGAERIEKFVLCNTAAYTGPSSWKARIEAVHAGGMQSVTETVLNRWFTPEFLASEPVAVKRVRDMLLTTSPQGYAGCCGALRDMDLRPYLPLNGTPTLVIGGKRDPAAPPENSEEIANSAQNARLVLLDAAHLSNVELPALFTGTVMEFLK